MANSRPQYSALLLDHFRHPRRVGGWSQPDTDLYTGQAGTPATGGVIRLQLRRCGDIISEARFQAYGCAATIAVGSWLADWLSGKTVTEAQALDHRDIETALTLPPAKVRCAVLAISALQAALNELI